MRRYKGNEVNCEKAKACPKGNLQQIEHIPEERFLWNYQDGTSLFIHNQQTI